MVVEFLYELVEAELDEGLTRNLVVVLGEEAAPFTKDRVSFCVLFVCLLEGKFL